MTDSSPPRIDLRLLRQFVAVAEELHFRRAAARLSISQPSLSAAIRRLEAEIGATLIERGRKTVGLTVAGAALLTEARGLLAHADEVLVATRDAATGRSGRARLGHVGSAMHGRLPGAIRAFRRTHPGVRLELREMTTAAQLAALRAGDLDLAVVIPPLSDEGGLVTMPFDTDRLVIALPASHRLARAGGVMVGDLADEPFVLWPREEGRGFHDRVTRLCAAAGFAPAVVQEAHGLHAVLSLVAVEVGVAIVPAGMAGVRPDEIVYHPLGDESAAFALVLCRREGEPDPATALLEAALRR